MNSGKLRTALFKAGKALWKSTPMILGVVLLISLANAVLPESSYSTVFSKDPLLDPFIGSTIGSVLAGNPITSYIIGGELLKEGVSLLAVTAFLVAWVSVGIVQFPAEAVLLGRKFAAVRNVSAFAFSIIVAILTVLIMGIL